MSKQYKPIPQSINGITAYALEQGLTLSRYTQWRLTERILGMIHGLPSSYGVLVATDGILCHIVNGSGNIFVGHIHHFEPDDRDVVVSVKETKAMKNAKRIKIEYQ